MVKVDQREANCTDYIPLTALGQGSSEEMQAYFIEGWGLAYRCFKRGSDLIGAICLAVVALPFLPLVGASIKLDSPGPVFYRQARVGKDEKTFLMLKFRTMIVDAEAAGARYADKDDPRVTKAGRWLRKSRIDEVPQVWNVLRGEMSLIGPRPERPENLDMLREGIPGFRLRTLVRPGLTGWAQVKVPYANTVDQTAKKVEYDLYYIRHASVALDLKIVRKTLRVMVGLGGQ